MSTKVNKAANANANGHGLPGHKIGNIAGVKRLAETQQNGVIESVPDPKKIREAVSAQTRLPDDQGRLKSKFWNPFILPWTKKGLKEGSRRKWPRPSEPITKIEDVPEGWRWDPMDEDVDSDDIDGNIVRSKKRIKDGIMPQVFETRLSTYKMLKAHRDKLISSEKRGLSLDVVKRLDNLKIIEKSLEENGDAWEELPNVKAIIKAYRSKKLKWSNEGEATYWFQGTQLCEPKKWSWSDIIKVNQEVQGSKGFWVEGIDGPGPTGVFFAWSWTPDPAKLTFQHHIQFEIRVPPLIGHPPMKPTSPGSLGWRGRFFDDTGSEAVTIFDDDLNEIMNLAPQGIRVPVIGEYNMITVGGKSVTHRNIVLQARVIGPGEHAMTNWYSVRVAVWPTSQKVDVPVRLSGGWWRHVLYVANAPDNRGHLYASTTKQDLCKMLPDVDFQQAQGPKNVPPPPPPPSGAPPSPGPPKGPHGGLSGGPSGGSTPRAPYGPPPGFPLRAPSHRLPYAAPPHVTSFPPEYLVHGIYPEYPWDFRTSFQKGPFGSDPYTQYVPWTRVRLPLPPPTTRPTSVQTQGQTEGQTEDQTNRLSEDQKGKEGEEPAPENDKALIPGRTYLTTRGLVTIESSGPSTLGSDRSTSQKGKQRDPGPEPAQPQLWGYFFVLPGQGLAPGWYYCPPPPGHLGQAVQ
ncbi:hypothetical protein N7526_000756 [Penicillium atrosanguineum]|nr:hypothetical protein N7526_000756 [Penicillium atrosanguineum]